MCVMMGPEVVINNAFLAKKEVISNYMEFSSLREFCNILHEKITGDNRSGISYKYAYFQVDEADIEKFCDLDAQFIRGIDKIFCTRIVEQEDVDRINSMYAQEVQDIIEEARDTFAAL